MYLLAFLLPSLTVVVAAVAAALGTPQGLSVLHAFLRALQPSVAARQGAAPTPGRGPSGLKAPAPLPALSELPVHFQVGHTFEVEGVGSVVSGTAVQGALRAARGDDVSGWGSP